jgi:endoglucanase
VDFETRAASQDVRLEWDWGNVGNLGLFTYLLSERAGRNPERVAAIRDSTLAVANDIVYNTNQHAYGRGIGSSYYWGINGTVVRTSINLEVAYRLDPQASYRDAALQQVEHVLGRNAQGRSQLTGVGYRPPLFPHHRPSISDGVVPPWPGLLVGGAHPNATDWVDAQDDYETNEVALNWNAALVYALAGLLP